MCALLAVAADSPTPQPLATLDVAKLLREINNDSIPTTALFSSDNSIAVGPCPSAGYAKCSLPVVRWENGTLKETAETAHVTPQSARHRQMENERYSTSMIDKYLSGNIS